MAGKGGWLGGGRPKGSKNKVPKTSRKAKELLDERILNYWTPMIDSLIASGMGKLVEVRKTKKGDKYFYDVPPNFEHVLKLIEFVVGKPLQPLKGTLDGTIETPQMDRIAADLRSILNAGMEKIAKPTPPEPPAPTVSSAPIAPANDQATNN